MATAPGQELDVALDPFEGAAICASGGYNALSIVALAERGGFLRCPDTYMEKIAVGPEGRGVIDLNKTPTENLRALAEVRGVYVADLTVAILDRPRHERLIEESRRAGARVKLLTDGDVAAALATTRPDTGHRHVDRHRRCAAGHPDCRRTALRRWRHAGALPAAQRRGNRARQVGIHDFEKSYSIEEMASGSIMFAGTGVTKGDYLDGVRFFRGGAMTNSVVMRSRTHTVRLIRATHRFDLKPDY